MDRDNGIFYEMLTYPMTRAQYLLGKALFNLAIAVGQAGVTVLLAAALLGVPIHWPGLPLLVGGWAGQIPEQHRNREQSEAGDQQAGDGAGAEGDGQALLQAGAGRLGGADVGAHRNVHADEAGDSRQQ